MRHPHRSTLGANLLRMAQKQAKVNQHKRNTLKMNTLRNTYHNTSVRIKSALSWEQIDDMAHRAESKPVTRRTVDDRRIIALRLGIKRALCGSKNCTCGTVR